MTEAVGTRRAFTGAGLLISVASVAGIAVSLSNDASLFAAVAVAMLGLGLFYVYVGATDYLTRTTDQVEDPDSGLFWVGTALAILLPFVGFVIGVVFLIRGRNSHGLRLIIGSIGVALLYGVFFYYR